MNTEDISQFLNALHVPAACMRAGGQLEAYNSHFKALYSAAEIGRPYALVVRQPTIVSAVDTVIATGESQGVLFEASAGFRDVKWLVTASELADGGQRWVLLTFEDRTAMEESAQIRRDFVANVSHELRSPLTALLGFIETLRTVARDDPATRERFLTIMEREANRMSRLVHDLLSLSRVESEERLRPTGSIELTGLIDSILNVIGPTAEAANVRFQREGFDAPVEMPADADQLRQVFTNLIENAVKYGGAGGLVEIRVSHIDHDPALRTSAVRVDVADHGEGFDPLHIPRLTERFYRVDDHRSREMGGTGLGLAIVKHIVNRHRGRLKIETTPGQGSVFSVLLPR